MSLLGLQRRAECLGYITFGVHLPQSWQADGLVGDPNVLRYWPSM